ncbi:MAG TPA: hypothetical protein DCM67_10750 [Propionibacteriaceae bacterium]|nr:hypothetical protein [Propionibacteriaceae bacterium]
MKRNGALQIIFAIFLGLVLVAFVWIGLLTFYPMPEWSEDGDKAIQMWQLTSGILLLVIATAISAVSLSLPARLEVISNGLLLGGIFTMLSSVGVAFTLEVSGWRFAVVTAALVVTVGIGYLRFARGSRRGAPVADLPHDAAAVGAPVSGAVVDPALAARVATLESRLDALRRALDDPAPPPAEPDAVVG